MKNGRISLQAKWSAELKMSQDGRRHEGRLHGFERGRVRGVPHKLVAGLQEWSKGAQRVRRSRHLQRRTRGEEAGRQ